MTVAAFVVIAAAPVSSGENRARTAAARLVPVLFGFACATLPLAWLNHLRFGSWNPISYGPIPWMWLQQSEIQKMTLGAQLRYSAMPLLLVSASLGGAYLARRRRSAVLAVALAALVVLVTMEPLRGPFIRYAAVAWGYLVDMSFVDMGPRYPRAPDGLGRVFARWVVKSTLQCTPLIALAPFALRGAGAKRWPLLALLLPCAALYVSLVMRANLAYPDAIGWPWVYIRYTLAALPALLVASVVVAERIEVGRELRIILVTAALACGMLVVTRSDTLLAKRILVLLAPLLLAGASALAVSRAARSPRAAVLARRIVALTAGLGIAIALGHDLRANVDVKTLDDEIVDELVAVVPQRFALVGVLGQFDVVMTTAATHDVQYADADVLRLETFQHLRPLLDHWRKDGRTIYVSSLEAPLSPWPDVTVRPVPGVRRLYELVFP